MRSDFNDAQRIVLHGRPKPGHHWTHVRHLMLRFEHGSMYGSPLRFLKSLPKRYQPTAANEKTTDLQISLGFTRRGLERGHVPDHVLSRLAAKAPAYWDGPALRASSRLGMSGRNGSSRWDAAFKDLDAVLSIHAACIDELPEALHALQCHAAENGVRLNPALPGGELLTGPEDKAPGMLVHFGFRDGLSHVHIAGHTSREDDALCSKPGEFLLGHLQDCGSVNWIGGPGLRVWPQPLRDFFRNGSFGVLHQIEQDVGEFERFIASSAGELKLDPDIVRAKLCGRYPAGRVLGLCENSDPIAEFDFRLDTRGDLCPFGSHIRRMNPRLKATAEAVKKQLAKQSSCQRARAEAEQLPQAAHSARVRALLRRGMPYGPAWRDGDRKERGLLGHFFCASIEDQYEHLIGQWAERVPLGTPDPGGARDPLIGNHEQGDRPFIFRHVKEAKGEKNQNEKDIGDSASASAKADASTSTSTGTGTGTGTGVNTDRGSCSCSVRAKQADERGTQYTLSGFKPFTRTLGLAYLFYPSVSTLRGIADSDPWLPDDPPTG